MAAQGTFAADLGGSVAHLSVARSLAALDALLGTGCTRVAVARMDVSTWFAHSHGTEVAGARPGGSLGEPTREELDLLDPAERLSTLEAWLAAQTGTILGLDGPAESARPLISQGLDSLMAVELRARVASVLGVHLAVPLILDGASVESLAVEMLHGWQMTVTQDGSSGPAGGDVDLLDPASAEALLAEVDNLSDEEVDRLLKQIAGREW
jgi:hypothetical protein